MRSRAQQVKSRAKSTIRRRAVPLMVVGMSGAMFTTVLVGPAGAAAKITPDKSYVLKSTAEAIHQLDPVTNIDTCNVNSMANIYDQLVRTTQSGQLAPGLA